MEVTRISTETILPSSPTAPQLKTFKVSLIDKLMPGALVPLILFYRPTTAIDHHIQLLKNALSETLTRFYPLAGRLEDDQVTIDCNDTGALFVTAQVKGNLSDLLQQPQIHTFYGFVPPYWKLNCPDSGDDRQAQLAVQANIFSCGGLAIGILINHKVMDITSITAFLKCWSAISNKGQNSNTFYPDFMTAPSLLPVVESVSDPDDSTFFIEKSVLKEGKGIIKRFVFEAEAVSKLKAKAASELVPNPTRLETLSSFIWMHMMAASKKVWGSKHPSMLSFTVDLRRRMSPPLPTNCIGNILWKVMAHCDEAMDLDLGGIVGILRKTLEDVKEKSYIQKIVSGGADAVRENFYEKTKEACRITNLNPYFYTSWCRMGLNEVDFGWGNPVWVSQLGANSVESVSKSWVSLLEGTTSDIVEAWLILDQREMAALEQDDDFLAFASPNPPVVIS